MSRLLLVMFTVGSILLNIGLGILLLADQPETPNPLIQRPVKVEPDEYDRSWVCLGEFCGWFYPAEDYVADPAGLSSRICFDDVCGSWVGMYTFSEPNGAFDNRPPA